MENHREEDRQTIIRQKDRELRRSVRVCGGEEKRQRMIRFVLLIILIIAAIAGIILWKRYSPSKEQYDMKKYYGIEKDGQVGITVIIKSWRQKENWQVEKYMLRIIL